MASSPTFSSQPVGVWKSLRADVISVTLKFGFYQSRVEYSITDTFFSVIEQLYYDAERWIREIVNTSRNGQLVGRYTIYLYRIPATDFSMVPIVQSSDIEQNSLIEIVLVPAEVNEHPHSLYRCQLNVPTNCSKCTRFIAGLYKQGFRCRNCRMTFHRDCAPFLLDDCPAEVNANGIATGRSGVSNLTQLILDNPFAADAGSSQDRITNPQVPIVPLYSVSVSTIRESAEHIAPNVIIEKGIFPACIRGAHFHRRYLFRLTINTLSMTTNLSPSSVSQKHLSQSNDAETAISLADIENLVLTHLMDDRDDVFEIHLRGKTVISVGKKTDSDELQMETAQFYSSVRDQRETLVNATPPPPPPPRPVSASPVPGATGISTPNLQPKTPPPLTRKKSNFLRSPTEKGIEDKDLHELYTITGEKIGEGAFGRVMGAYRKSTQQALAIKIIEKANCGEQDIRRINEEIDNLYKFNHINILKLEAYYERDEAVYLVTERLETDMCKYITTSPNGYLDEDICKILTFQVIVALKYLHKNHCGHLDVKCENILLTRLKPVPTNSNKPRQNGINYNQDFPLVKLADFGYSRIIGEHSFRKTRVGTKVYNAPEIYNSKLGYNRLADMWSAGIVLFAALSGSLPYDEKSYSRAREIVRDKNTLFANPRWTRVSKEAIDLLSKQLLVIQVDARGKPSDVLFQDWFTDPQLYKNLREIEKRTKYLMSTRQEEITPLANWLTAERDDLVWAEYRSTFS